VRSQSTLHVGVLLVALLATACGTAASQPPSASSGAGATTQSSPVLRTIKSSGGPPTTDFTDGLSWNAGGQRVLMDAQINAPLDGWVTPVSLPFDGGVIVNSWKPREGGGGHPALIFARGADRKPIGVGAHSVAVGPAGIAYAQGLTPDYVPNVERRDNIVVQSTVDSPGVIWSSRAAKYSVAAWAGTQLVAYEWGAGESRTIHVFSGANTSFDVSAGDSLLAVSPEGSELLVSGSDGAGIVLSRIDVHTGSILGSQRLPPQFVLASYAGDWLGRVAAFSSGDSVITLTMPAMTIRSVDQFSAGMFPHGVREPMLDRSGDVLVWADYVGGDSQVMLRCAAERADCQMSDPVRGPLYPSFSASRPDA